MEKRFEYLAQLAIVIILVAGCFLVLKPFLTAALLAVVVCVSTWPIYQWLLRKFHGHQNFAALCMTLSLSLVVILPLALVAYHLSDNVAVIYEEAKQFAEYGPSEPPDWIKGLPIIGAASDAYWHLVANSKKELAMLVGRLLEPAKNFLLAGGLFLWNGVVEMSLAAFVSFFIYRDGNALMRFVHVAMERVTASNAAHVIAIMHNTMRAVMYGLLGTALTQGTVATIGFFIAGIPAALLLGVATFMVSMIPIGPPLIWGGAVAYLFFQGSTGWGIFMLCWGFLISSVDNVIEPMLISRSSKLPFILGLFGITGGILAFGFVGIFIGPTLLALGFSLLKEWAALHSTSASQNRFSNTPLPEEARQ